MVLSGQNILIDRLLFHTSRPFASQLVGRTLLEGLTRDQMGDYLARGALLAAAARKEPIVTAEHVRLAATEIL
jgi:type II secretory pathway predicted ATPase ExeA